MNKLYRVEGNVKRGRSVRVILFNKETKVTDVKELTPFNFEIVKRGTQEGQKGFKRTFLDIKVGSKKKFTRRLKNSMIRNIMITAHKQTKLLRDEFPNIDYKFQLGLYLKELYRGVYSKLDTMDALTKQKYLKVEGEI